MTVVHISSTTKGATALCSWPYVMPIANSYIDIGCNGRVSDGGVWENTKISTLIATGAAGLPNDSVLEGSERLLPYVFLLFLFIVCVHACVYI